MISPSQRPLLDSTQHSQETDFHVSSGILTRIPASERPQTHALDRAASGIGLLSLYLQLTISALSCLSLQLEPGILPSGKIFSFSKVNLFFLTTVSHSSSSFSPFLWVYYSYSSFSSSSYPPLLRANQVKEDSDSGKKCGHSELPWSVFPVYDRRRQASAIKLVTRMEEATSFYSNEKFMLRVRNGTEKFPL